MTRWQVRQRCGRVRSVAGMAEWGLPVLGADGQDEGAAGIVASEGLGGYFAKGIGSVAADDAGDVESLQPQGETGCVWKAGILRRAIVGLFG